MGKTSQREEVFPLVRSRRQAGWQVSYTRRLNQLRAESCCVLYLLRTVPVAYCTCCVLYLLRTVPVAYCTCVDEQDTLSNS